jgi:hypothetical protein
MSPDGERRGSVRSAAVVNEEIRALWGDRRDPRVQLVGDARERLDELYAEWADAVRAEIVKAA